MLYPTPNGCSEGVRDIYSAEGNAIDPDTPLVVLVNRGTASASEVRTESWEWGEGSLVQCWWF